MNKKYVKLLALLLVATMMTTALLGCKAKEEPVTTEPTAEATDAPTAVEPEAQENEPTRDTQAETETDVEIFETEPEEETIETKPEEEIIETKPEVDAPEPGSITYEEYLALDVEVQQAYYERFETPDSFFKWLHDAEMKYKDNTEPVDPVDPNDDVFAEEGVEDLE